MDYYDEIKNKLIDNGIYERVKDHSKERYKVRIYYEIGKLLNDAGGKYGDNIIDEYSKKLTMEIGKKYNRRTLFRMKQFYNTFSEEKVSTMWTQLTWSHVRLLLGMNYDSINYYIYLTTNKHVSVRQLEEMIKNHDYERLPESTKTKFIENRHSNMADFIKNPVIINYNNKYEIITERVLQKLVLEDIESFMREWGSLFSFVGSEYKIKLGDKYNYIDLLLFNIEYNCYVVIELKVTELKKEHIGQIQVYMNYIDKNIKKFNQDKTIGIIICKKDNNYIIEYCSDSRIVSREYKLE